MCIQKYTYILSSSKFKDRESPIQTPEEIRIIVVRFSSRTQTIKPLSK